MPSISVKASETSISLLTIRELPEASVINRKALRLLGPNPVSVDLNFRVIPDLEQSTVSVIVTCSYTSIIEYIRTRLLVCPVLATFEVENLKEHVSISGSDAILGSRLMMIVLGVAIGSLRGIIAVRSAGTRLEKYPLPLVDLSMLMHRLNYDEDAPSHIFRI